MWRTGRRAPSFEWTLMLPLWLLVLSSVAWGATAGERELVRVRIGANVMGGLDWNFWPTIPEVSLKPGESTQVTYRVRNRSAKAVFGKAFHGTTPAEGEGFVEIIGCFCDQAMRLNPGEERELTLLFRIRWDIPERLRDLLVAYDFWPATEEEVAEAVRHGLASP